MLDMLLLITSAVGAAWYFTRKEVPRQHHKALPFTQDYFIGLNYLLNEQPDKAVDIFVKMLEVDPETVEIHLALGNLFRRRGEVGKAIRMHQNLIARPDLAKKQRLQALLALGEDYLRAGVLDRAERLFLEVVDADSEYMYASLRFLLDIYQQEKEWHKAILTAKKLAILTKEKRQPQIAHYYCELAIQVQAKEQFDQAGRYLKQALAMDPCCVRASLLQAELALRMNQIETAIRYYQKIKDQEPDYISETIAPLAKCYELLGKETELLDYLEGCLKQYPQTAVMLAFTDQLQCYRSNAAATSFLTAQLKQHPSVQGLQKLLQLQLMKADSEVRTLLAALHEITLALLKKKSAYRCEHCGFFGKVLHWLCPSCRQWNTVKPVMLTGEEA